MPPICDFPSQATLERNPTLKKLIFFLSLENIETSIEIVLQGFYKFCKHNEWEYILGFAFRH